MYATPLQTHPRSDMKAQTTPHKSGTAIRFNRYRNQAARSVNFFTHLL